MLVVHLDLTVTFHDKIAVGKYADDLPSKTGAEGRVGTGLALPF